jgi:hypothetical protein
LDYLRVTKDQTTLNARKKPQVMNEISKPKITKEQKLSVNEAGEFVIPDHLRCASTDADKLRT